MEKIRVKVCLGTSCYVLGGSELTDLGQQIPAAWSDRIEVEGAVCLDLCRTQGRRPPFVLVDDHVVDQASVERVLAVLRGRLA